MDSNYSITNDEEKSRRRIRLLSEHILGSSSSPHNHLHHHDQIVPRICSAATEESASSSPSSSSKALSRIVSGKHRSIQEPILYYFRQHPELLNPVEMSKDDHRELAMRQLFAIVKEIGIRPLTLLSEDPAKYFALTEAVGHIDLSLAIKLGVQYR